MHVPSAEAVDSIVTLFHQYGEERYDEVVSQTEHALQSAALAAAAGAADALVAAALLHDLGHLLQHDRRVPDTPTEEDLHHETVAGRYLEPRFGRDVSTPVTLHVRAKRYLCAVDPSYAAELSPASVASLQRQGGPLDESGCRAFERLRGWDHAVALRRWDDMAKVPGLATASLEDYRPLLTTLVRP